jgi:23S rRNA (cytosine1962-C5)-methyltransferase
MVELCETPILMVGKGWPGGYSLIDSGNGRKLEKFGDYHFIRPEPMALWEPHIRAWQANGEFLPGSDEDGGGRWHLDASIPPHGWDLSWQGLTFRCQPTPFRHLQFFPDMMPVWEWISLQIPQGYKSETMNLFGYTGLASLVLSDYGPVTHVDASKKSVAQARRNADLSGMTNRPIRWLIDDATKFVAREVRRGSRYDGIILDPPKFGRGPKNETWRLEENLPGLLSNCRQLLDSDSKFLFVTVYAVRMSSLALAGLLKDLFEDLGGKIEHGDLAVQEAEERGRLLPTAIFARWSKGD